MKVTKLPDEILAVLDAAKGMFAQILRKPGHRIGFGRLKIIDKTKGLDRVGDCRTFEIICHVIIGNEFVAPRSKATVRLSKLNGFWGVSDVFATPVNKASVGDNGEETYFCWEGDSPENRFAKPEMVDKTGAPKKRKKKKK